MDIEKSFLKQIAAEPNNPDHRLVYADWLEEQGDERAKIVRFWEEHGGELIETKNVYRWLPIETLLHEANKLKELPDSWKQLMRIPRIGVFEGGEPGGNWAVTQLRFS